MRSRPPALQHPRFSTPRQPLSARVDSSRGRTVSRAPVVFYANGPRAAPGAAASYTGALVDLGSAFEALAPQRGGRVRRNAVLPPAALRLLAQGPRPGSVLPPASLLPRALGVLRLGGFIAHRARPGAMLGFAALSQRVRPEEMGEYVRLRPIQCAQYLVHTSDIQLTALAGAVPAVPAARAPAPAWPMP